MEIVLVFPLDENHLLISKPKRSFRASQPKYARVTMEGSPSRDCTDVNLSFQVRNSYIKYLLQDTEDSCFPYTIEGKWHMDFTKDEELEELVENAIKADLERMTKNERDDEKTDNDLLLDSI